MSRSITQTIQQVMYKRDVVISGIVSFTMGQTQSHIETLCGVIPKYSATSSCVIFFKT